MSTASELGYSADRTSVGGVTFVTIRGTLNEEFEGRKLASSFRTNKVVIDMRQVRRFASWGMQEWMGLLQVCADSDLYLVECGMYAVSQLNLITGLFGHAKLVSFYASYRCAGCGEEIASLLLIPRDRSTIRDMVGSSQPCPTCGASANLETYPAAFFDAIASRPPFDIDDEVLTFLRSRFQYDLSPDLTQFRAFRKTRKAYTYIRLSGNMSTLRADALARASGGTTIVDLAHVVFDPTELTGWRDYVLAAKSRVASLQLVNCPAGFLEHGLHPDDLRNKLSVRNFAISYECSSCGTQATYLVDVARYLEELVQGVIPPVRCSQCKAENHPTASTKLRSLLFVLPARSRDLALDSFLAKSQGEPIEKLENCLDLQPAKMPTTPASGRRTLFIMVALSMLVAAGGIATLVWSRAARNDQNVVSVGSAEPVIPPTPMFTRPDWILSAVPSSGYCHDVINRLMCVGVSAFRSNRDDAVADAIDVALEQLVNDVGLKITDATFKDEIPLYSERRGALLSELQAAELNRQTDANAAAAFAVIDETVRETRKRVVAALRESGGPAVPAQRSDWYWEEYTNENGKGSEFLVFIRFDLSIDAVRTLVEKYSTTSTLLGSTAITAFPALAWTKSTFTTGALLAKVRGALADAGILAQQIVVAVGGQRVIDAPSFAKAVDTSTGDMKLTISTGDATKVVTVKRR